MNGERNDFLNSISIKTYLLNYQYKRTSPGSSVMVRGSATVEAALTISIFMFFIINIYSLFFVFESYSVKLGKIHDEVKALSVATSMLDTTSSEYVELWNLQEIKPLINEIGFPQSYAVVYGYSKKWTGYDLLNGIDTTNYEECVYVTNYGTVYHRLRNCSFLQINIKAVDKDKIDGERNVSGEKYKACERCGKSNTGLVFITNYGNRYHGNIDCSTLKRTVKVITLRKAIEEGKAACSKCG